MSNVRNPFEDYVLGNGAQEQQRLKLQGRFLEKWTEQFLLSAGVEPGMSVLDLGCGMGDVLLLASRLVGTTGHVTAIDRDPVIINKARERTRDEERGATIEFIHAELLSFHAERSFDAVVGRYVLFFQPDPVAAIAHAAKQVRPHGIIVFHEMDLANRIRSYPNGTLFERMWALVAQADLRGGVWIDLGLHLTRLFLDAGLP
jgi:ubiquinone/menaquinone biosynthesis C-methylase UbiE